VGTSRGRLPPSRPHRRLSRGCPAPDVQTIARAPTTAHCPNSKGPHSGRTGAVTGLCSRPHGHLYQQACPPCAVTGRGCVAPPGVGAGAPAVQLELSQARRPLEQGPVGWSPRKPALHREPVRGFRWALGLSPLHQDSRNGCAPAAGVLLRSLSTGAQVPHSFSLRERRRRAMMRKTGCPADRTGTVFSSGSSPHHHNPRSHRCRTIPSSRTRER
jgi:hypothetical protein